jgi:SAM-dependent methyltransferase
MPPMLERVRKLTSCRLCGEEQLREFVDFGDVPLGNDLRETAEDARSAPAFPLEVVRCGSCGHFQLRHAVAPELLYATNYTYLSGIGASFVRHFDNYAKWAQDRCDLPEAAMIVDVGSNDGTCLKAFQSRGHRVCGVDPASLAAQIANEHGIETINAFFDADAVAEITQRHGRADFVTSHNVLAHVDDLGDVFRNIHGLLKDGGWFAFEVGYFRQVLQTGYFDTIYHEHLDYHHAAPLARHLTSLGFDLVELSTNEIQGGSLRLLLRKTGSGRIDAQPRAFLDDEERSVLYDEAFLADWRSRIESKMASLHEAVLAAAREDRTVIGYGAPTKATLLMKVGGLGPEHIRFVVEDNPHKAGRFLPRTGIPIRPSAEIGAAAGGAVVIFAWNFAADIIEKLQGLLPGAKAITPLPEVSTTEL